VFNLHTMDADGGNVTQISFNQSHDRNPTVLQNGDIMYSRWDHVGGRNHFKVFRAKPDGTDMFVLYGAHSEGNSFLHPRDMDPKGKYAGFLASDLMPMSGTHEGGGLVFIDAPISPSRTLPATPGVTGQGQNQATAQLLSLGRGVSQYGRITTPFPLWDGTDRVHSSRSQPCEVTRVGVGVVSCATLSADEMARLGMEERLVEDIQKDSIQDNVQAVVRGLHVRPETADLPDRRRGAARLHEHPTRLRSSRAPSRPQPSRPTSTRPSRRPTSACSKFAASTTPDGLGRMSSGVLAAVDLPAGCTSAIAMTAPTDPLDTRSQVADLAKMKNPGRCCLRLRAGALHPRRSRRRSDERNDRHAQRDR